MLSDLTKNYCGIANLLGMSKQKAIGDLDIRTIDRIIQMAWEDRTPFDAIEEQFGLKEKDVINLMRREMKASSFRMWRKRMTGRQTKHMKKREFEVGRFKSKNQKARLGQKK